MRLLVLVRIQIAMEYSLSVLLILLLIPSTFSTHQSTTRVVFVGQPFRIELDAALSPGWNRTQIPAWTTLSKDGMIVEGVPQIENLGFTQLYEYNGLKPTIRIDVEEEAETHCGEGPTTWIELLNGKSLSEISIREQM